MTRVPGIGGGNWESYINELIHRAHDYRFYISDFGENENEVYSLREQQRTLIKELHSLLKRIEELRDLRYDKLHKAIDENMPEGSKLSDDLKADILSLSHPLDGPNAFIRTQNAPMRLRGARYRTRTSADINSQRTEDPILLVQNDTAYLQDTYTPLYLTGAEQPMLWRVRVLREKDNGTFTVKHQDVSVQVGGSFCSVSYDGGANWFTSEHTGNYDGWSTNEEDDNGPFYDDVAEDVTFARDSEGQLMFAPDGTVILTKSVPAAVRAVQSYPAPAPAPAPGAMVTES